ncbi:MAG TPA: rRNA adenine N(6)-methyltransferase family protein [Myxococcota bacterium]|nr:rRNA adenine N(6)-methyltransferase family protein [Myxococcota bacterium]
MSAYRRTARDARRRSLGQNFLRPEIGRELVAAAGFEPGQLVFEIGAGSGALTRALAAHPIEVIAIELDPVWAERLRADLQREGHRRVRVVRADFFRVPLPSRPFRVIGSLPFGRTTEICRRLFDDPSVPLERADLIVQWDVARIRAAQPPSTLLSTVWAPWWEFRLERRIAAGSFRPIPRTDAGMIAVRRRVPPLLPVAMARAYDSFLRERWPFDRSPR